MDKNTNALEPTLQRRDSNLAADSMGLSHSTAESILVAYRSAGIGVFGVVMRYAGMPLEKIALYMNSSQVSGKGQFAQATRLAFQDGFLAPYKVVGPSSMVAWFLQYGVMGLAFQSVDQALSQAIGVRPVYYGSQLMEPPLENNEDTFSYQMKFAAKTFAAPFFAAALESQFSNRAEVQRYFGIKKFAQLETRLALNPIARAAGPAFLPNAMRNVIMTHTSFVLTPVTYKLYFPQEQKNASTLFWYGLSVNVFVGNVVAITQQALWGRTLDYAAKHGSIHYGSIVREGLKAEGMSAFITVPRWFSRVLMNAPCQGVLPWFYNEVLPLGEEPVLSAAKSVLCSNAMDKRRSQSTNQGLMNASNTQCADVDHPDTVDG
eukprot:CAMPEP_0195267174 /NCGR_PEP_ID=MMETSP0706-20130129/12435_1 /TAXON_ID=33640 /ORGANISM="Asterionellopsis glacialis, Strain CCMP134" /LENGTH=375 /DNA_ID=CAMNT_0040321879 /DNA_START=263 /DNA_END=1391 /DNA_ORIENTATION=-